MIVLVYIYIYIFYIIFFSFFQIFLYFIFNYSLTLVEVYARDIYFRECTYFYELNSFTFN